jgi:hypothetical protein
MKSYLNDCTKSSKISLFQTQFSTLGWEMISFQTDQTPMLKPSHLQFENSIQSLMSSSYLRLIFWSDAQNSIKLFLTFWVSPNWMQVFWQWLDVDWMRQTFRFHSPIDQFPINYLSFTTRFTFAVLLTFAQTFYRFSHFKPFFFVDISKLRISIYSLWILFKIRFVGPRSTFRTLYRVKLLPIDLLNFWVASVSHSEGQMRS